uniref:Uncharacterized protein n=1 Tax=Rhizophora mucronata TaxID=61149 RepID=A0A2P2QVZ2_RHIMU
MQSNYQIEIETTVTMQSSNLVELRLLVRRIERTNKHIEWDAPCQRLPSLLHLGLVLFFFQITRLGPQDMINSLVHH